MRSWLSRLMCPSLKDFSVCIDFRFSLITALHISLSIHLLPNDCLSIFSTLSLLYRPVKSCLFSFSFNLHKQVFKLWTFYSGNTVIFLVFYIAANVGGIYTCVHSISYRFSCIFIWSAEHTMEVNTVDASKLRILGKINFKEIREKILILFIRLFNLFIYII